MTTNDRQSKNLNHHASPQKKYIYITGNYQKSFYFMESIQLNLFQKTDSTGAQEIIKQIEIIEALLIFKSAKKENNAESGGQ